MLSTASPFPQYFDLDGDPLDAGYLYFGQAGQNPETAPVAVFWDADGMLPAAQPIRTLSGFAARAGSPALVFVAEDYSLTVRNKRGVLVSYSPSSSQSSNDFILQEQLNQFESDVADGEDAAKGAGQVGFDIDTPYLNGVGLKLRETPSYFDFMTGPNRNAEITDALANTRQVDVTYAINAAHLWASTNQRTIYARAGGYLCGQVDTYPTLTVVGDGRHRTNFWCAPGTTGAWWSDRSNGAVKLTLSGMAFYGQGELGLTHVGAFGLDGTADKQFGTEGNLSKLWFRDAPNAIALALNANVGLIDNITLQSCDQGLDVLGDANMGRAIVIVDMATQSARVSAGFWSDMEIEAPASGSLPLNIFRSAHFSGLLIALASGTTFTRLIDIDTSAGDDWSVAGLELRYGAGATATSVFKQGATTWDGRRGANYGQTYVRNALMEVATVQGGLMVGVSADAVPVMQVLKKVASLDFPSIAAGGNQILTVTVAGAVAGLPAEVGFPASGPFSGLRYEAYVSADDTVTVIAYNMTGAPIDPPSQTFSIVVFVYA